MDSTATAAPAAGPLHRLLGALILTKALLPLLLLLLLAWAAWRVVAGVIGVVEDARQAIAPHLAAAERHIEAVRGEGARLMGEVRKIENATTQIVGSVQQSVEPIRQSLAGLAGATQAATGTVAHLLNAVVRVLNGLPGVNLPRLALPRIEIPGFSLKLPELDLHLKPNLQAVEDFNAAAQAAAAEAQQAVGRIAEILRFWLRVLYAAVVLVLLWLLLGAVGYVARVAHRVATGWRMLCGQRVEGALALL